MLATAFEPSFPLRGGSFENLAVELHREAAALAAGVHPITLVAVPMLFPYLIAPPDSAVQRDRPATAEDVAAVRAAAPDRPVPGGPRLP